MQMKLFSFLVLLFAFLGSGSSPAFANTIQVLQNIEQAANSSLEISEVAAQKNPERQRENIDLQANKITGNSTFLFHTNFSIHRLTCYYSSRLRN